MPIDNRTRLSVIRERLSPFGGNLGVRRGCRLLDQAVGAPKALGRGEQLQMLERVSEAARSVADSIMIMPPRADAQDGRERIAVEAFFVASILTEAHAAAARTR